MNVADLKHISWQLHDCDSMLSVDEVGSRTRASVAMILHQGGDGLELLFIQRATNEHDPWSGHIAFPGGKLEDGENECDAAYRETIEETSIDLGQAEFLGRLPDIIGANLPVRVSCCIYVADRKLFAPVLNDEVCDLFWVKFSDLTDSRRHQQATVSFGEKKLTVPAILLPVENKPVLWGITYRLVMQLIQLLDKNETCSKSYNRLPEMVELNEEVEHD